LPTATHFAALAHDTPLRYVPVAPVGIGAFENDHRLPFQRTTSGMLGDFSVARELPTATQLRADGHETATSALAMPRRFGVDTTDHRRPFHFSTSGRVVPATVTTLPTAMQTPPVGAHDTASR